MLDKKLKLMLVCSSGGHLLQMVQLMPLWDKFDSVWVTFEKEDALCLLENKKVYWAYSPTNRNIKNFFKNLILAFKLISKERPDVLITSGAGVGVPFCYAGRILGCKIIFIESFARIKNLSLSGKLIYPFAHLFLVQWEGLQKRYKKAVFKGSVYDLGDGGDSRTAL